MGAETELTHLDEAGRAHMVDIGAKEVTDREAVAEGHVAMAPELAERFFSGDLPKGDAAAAARLAGIMAAKRTSELIPLCHPITLTGLDVALEPSGRGIRVIASVRATDRTGVEMEAMTAVAVAALTIYDMVKGVERGVTIETVRLMRKTGGKSGKWERG
ncbi:MAG TPA: cyclic pyranopterin monophosphate synthase MoaC [Acidimicrobiia bacterium]|nr:cyclic pyranopterin monophosphate synthase MoaC [Acidimicrobiia bacterium]